MLQVVWEVVHGIFIRPSKLAIWFYTTHLTNFSIRSCRRMEWYTPVYYAAKRVSHSWGGWGFNSNWSRPCHTTRFWFGKMFLSCTNIYFTPISCRLTSELRSFGPSEAAHAGGGASFAPYYIYTCPAVCVAYTLLVSARTSTTQPLLTDVVPLDEVCTVVSAGTEWLYSTLGRSFCVIVLLTLVLSPRGSTGSYPSWGHMQPVARAIEYHRCDACKDRFRRSPLARCRVRFVFNLHT